MSKLYFYLLMIVLTLFLVISAYAETDNSLDVWANFSPSGWMGDAEFGDKYVTLDEGWEENPHSAPVCMKIIYTPVPNKGWAGVYWQNKPDNWGDQPGENFSKKKFTKITFWAKGEKGNEIVEFKAGGINNPGKKFRDSFEVSSGRKVLTREWKKYEIDLEDQKLTSVIGIFCWLATGSGNPKGAVFYLDDIFYE
jgi:hypothetical protein